MDNVENIRCICQKHTYKLFVCWIFAMNGFINVKGVRIHVQPADPDISIVGTCAAITHVLTHIPYTWLLADTFCKIQWSSY